MHTETSRWPTAIDAKCISGLISVCRIGGAITHQFAAQSPWLYLPGQGGGSLEVQAFDPREVRQVGCPRWGQACLHVDVRPEGRMVRCGVLFRLHRREVLPESPMLSVPHALPHHARPLHRGEQGGGQEDVVELPLRDAVLPRSQPPRFRNRTRDDRLSPVSDDRPLGCRGGLAWADSRPSSQPFRRSHLLERSASD